MGLLIGTTPLSREKQMTSNTRVAISKYESIQRQIVLLAVATAFVMVALCTQTFAKGMSSHYYPNPPIAHGEVIDDPASPCTWLSTKQTLILGIFRIIFPEYKFLTIEAVEVFANVHKIREPNVTNIRSIDMPKSWAIGCTAGVAINGNLVLLDIPGNYNQIEYTVKIDDKEKKKGAATLLDKKFVKRTVLFWATTHADI
jgi:hypothetical protein